MIKIIYDKIYDNLKFTTIYDKNNIEHLHVMDETIKVFSYNFVSRRKLFCGCLAKYCKQHHCRNALIRMRIFNETIQMF